MSGLYIHIPFCKKRCSYCDFYTEVAPLLIPSLVNSIVMELKQRKEYLNDRRLTTIYFGGGTPSILSSAQFQLIFDAIYQLFEVQNDAEITFEANPDDLTSEFFQSISTLPFNRISIGIQSFDDVDLIRINRRHTGNQAVSAVKLAQLAGFKNISIDLIYGLPLQTLVGWKKQLDRAFLLNVQHISAYGLSYEIGTKLWKQCEAGTIKALEDESMNEMYSYMLECMEDNGFERYEISNFSLPYYRSRHNTSYWKLQPYLGVGPSAHSYDILSRQWNVSSIKEYIQLINDNIPYWEREVLTHLDRYNDYVMLALRTSDGIDLKRIEHEFGLEYANYCFDNLKQYIKSGKVRFHNDMLYLTTDGIKISNLILIDIMKV